MFNSADVADDSEFSPINIPPDVTTVDAIVRLLVQEVVRSKRLNRDQADEIISDALRRESLGSTCIGRGAAVPNLQTDFVSVPTITVGRCTSPVTWPGSPDGMPVTTVCLVIAPRSPEMHLQAMELAAENLLRLKVN